MGDRNVEGRVALVTGAASGIGAATARALVAAGAKVALVDLKDDVREVAESLGAQAVPVVLDLLDEDSAKSAVSATIDAFGGLDAVVNSAGILETMSIEELTRESYDRVMNINVKAPLFLTQAALAHLGPGASIVFIASGNAVLASPNGSVYAASKGALVSLVKGLAADLAPRGIRVNAISPGPIVTPMLSAALADPAVKESIERGVPAGRLGTPEEVASLAVYLISDVASFVHGASIAIDGGTTAVWSPAAPGPGME
ncbi:short-chain dehydrogenase [Nocardioides flavus (ex Wang et al. 2016)]|uniref:Short-chain dehydrogenase n=1 Tax=Nocardioides flavus (ex Wang et al. 2016) TaxID=2058780 RepID=A0ABQ3HKX2_9ACTN|nr:SDR family oxidoreductase [Nocardioides flavus (ex Wang et al. 2016)]GHE16754.1 short-chain dehydrogenase [Nocardioides flavus (ex Wang et al. 2016)]